MRFPRLLTVAALLVFGLSAAAPSGAAADDWSLPAPTGQFPVGVQEFHLVDDRPDIWAPEQNRELMVSAWYPALAPIGRPDPYTTTAEAALVLASQRVTGVTPDTLSELRTHAYLDAPRLGNPLPTVVLSPGFNMPRFTLTGLAEELASRGYLVLGIDHTYESAAITFPGGRITECLACTSDPNPAIYSPNRAADVSFVLDELIGRLPIDPARIAMGGHSAGGFAAPFALAQDTRLRAGFNMDGTFPAAPTGRATDQPFLMLGAPHHAPDGEYSAKWSAAYTAFHGWKRWITIDGTNHGSFTDFGPIADYLGVVIPGTSIAGDRAMQLTRACVVAFVDHHLRGLPAPILDGPDPANPELHFGG
ncbi:alpha/beta hydrolase [Nocardia sp. NPDC050712]|uniref:alpha/beta hydrolase family protein n=1 Tax=Nocardia sp. NPDC050712 TaxID=3155518 RepID=UPI0033F053EE